MALPPDAKQDAEQRTLGTVAGVPALGRALIPDLEHIDRDELRDLVVEAWLTRAQKRVAKAWLAEHEPEALD
jgi:hypothetical protein